MLEPTGRRAAGGFLAVLYLFLRGSRAARCATCAAPTSSAGRARPGPPPAPGGLGRDRPAPGRDARRPAPRSSSARPGTRPGMEYEIGDGAVLGRGDQAEIRLDDPFASEPPRAAHAPGRRRRARGPRLDERDVPQRGARSPARSRCTRATACGSATASSPSWPADDAARRRARRAHRHRPPAPGATRTPTTRARRCSPSPTAWAARRPARSPRAPRSTRSPPGLPDGAGSVEERLRARRPRGQRAHPRAVASPTRTAPAWARRSPPPTSATDEVTLVHVGDSRCYRWRDGELERLTDDHSLVEELVRQGKLTPGGGRGASAALDHHARARARGGRRAPTRSPSPARAGDVYLLCSDGLTSMVPEARIAEVLADARRRCARPAATLIDAANDAGGRDNITVVLFRLEEVGGAPAPDAADATRVGAPRAEGRGRARALARDAGAAAPRRGRRRAATRCRRAPTRRPRGAAGGCRGPGSGPR